MATIPPTEGSALEVISPDGSRRFVRIDQSPFVVGRGVGTGNHLQLGDRRISRHCAALVSEGGHWWLEDRGHRYGVFVNGTKIDRRTLEDNDVITFGVEDSYEIIFRTNSDEKMIRSMLDRMGDISTTDSTPDGLRKLNLLLQATSLLHSQLPLDSVLGTMLDHAIAITDADRGLLLEAQPPELFPVRLARGKKGAHLASGSVSPSQTALRRTVEQQSTVFAEDLSFSDMDLRGAPSIVEQQLRSIVAMPLCSAPRLSATGSTISKSRHLLGILYLDSQRPAAFSNLDRQILDALAVEAASILDSARLVEQERQRQRLDQELSIAREIQQALLPVGFRDFPHLAVSGVNSPCLAVGGDYFDVFPISDDRTAFLIADVSGKGLGAALLTTMLQGALSGLTIGGDPARIFHLINRFLCEHSEVGRYATLFFGILDAGGELSYINAGHPSPLLLRHGQATEPFTEGSFPVGLVPETTYVTSRVELQPDDTLILFSDGVTEAMDPKDRMFGAAGLRQVLIGRGEEPLDDIKKAILEAVQSFTGGASQADDITLLLIRYRQAGKAAVS